jgi:hypothetical protein
MLSSSKRIVRSAIAKSIAVGDRGDWPKAEIAFAAALEADPDLAAIWMQFGGRPCDQQPGDDIRPARAIR